MNCKHCGAIVANETLTICPYCGADIKSGARASSGSRAAGAAAYSHGRMTASMVLGIVSVAAAWFGWGALAGIATGVLALVFGIQSKRYAPQGVPTGMAKAGIICGAIGLGVSAVVFTGTVVGFI